MNNDVDLEQFAKILDSAINSDVPAVRKAMSNFLLITSLCMTDDDNGEDVPDGPFAGLLKNLRDLDRRVRALERGMFSQAKAGPSGGMGSVQFNSNPYDQTYTGNSLINHSDHDAIDKLMTCKTSSGASLSINNTAI